MRILQEVCSLLIKGSKTGPDAFTWYQMGVESHLRITNLYEYYMASVDLDSVLELPKVILMYFLSRAIWIMNIVRSCMRIC